MVKRMSVVVFTLVSTMCPTAISCGTSGTPCERWDDGYASVKTALEREAATLGAPVTMALRRMGPPPPSDNQSLAFYKCYEPIHELGASLMIGSTDAVRLEIIPPFAPYECIWVIRTAMGATLVRCKDGIVINRQLAAADWGQLQGRIEENWSGELESSGQFQQMDGTWFFASLCLAGRSTQFGYYGMLRWSPAAGEKKEQQWYRERAILQAIRDVGKWSNGAK